MVGGINIYQKIEAGRMCTNFTLRGAGVPLSCAFSSLVHSLPHLLLFVTFSFFVRFIYFLFCPFLPFLPE